MSIFDLLRQGRAPNLNRDDRISVFLPSLLKAKLSNTSSDVLVNDPQYIVAKSCLNAIDAGQVVRETRESRQNFGDLLAMHYTSGVKSKSKQVNPEDNEHELVRHALVSSSILASMALGDVTVPQSDFRTASEIFASLGEWIVAFSASLLAPFVDIRSLVRCLYRFEHGDLYVLCVVANMPHTETTVISMLIELLRDRPAEATQLCTCLRQLASLSSTCAHTIRESLLLVHVHPVLEKVLGGDDGRSVEQIWNAFRQLESTGRFAVKRVELALWLNKKTTTALVYTLEAHTSNPLCFSTSNLSEIPPTHLLLPYYLSYLVVCDTVCILTLDECGDRMDFLKYISSCRSSDRLSPNVCRMLCVACVCVCVCFFHIHGRRLPFHFVQSATSTPRGHPTFPAHPTHTLTRPLFSIEQTGCYIDGFSRWIYEPSHATLPLDQGNTALGSRGCGLGRCQSSC